VQAEASMPFSAVFTDFATPLQDLSCGCGADPEFLVSDTG